MVEGGNGAWRDDGKKGTYRLLISHACPSTRAAYMALANVNSAISEVTVSSVSYCGNPASKSSVPLTSEI